jgi:ABC-type transport system involved in multi-copper enzyme maturation permease subunit
MRTRRAVAALVGLALGAAALVLVRWPTGGLGDLSGATALQVLRVYSYGLLTGLLLILPAFPATAIVRERVSGTLALLLNSPMSVGAIYAGKLGGVLGYTALLLLATLPGAAACYALGGSTVGGGVGLLYLILAAVAVQLATLGLFISSRSTTSDGALRATYAAVLAVCVLPLVAHWLLPREWPPVAALAVWLGSLSPVPAMLEVVGQGETGLPVTDYPAGAIWRYLVVAAVMSAVCAAATLTRLSRSPLDRSRPPGVMTEDRSRGARAARRVFYLVDPQRRSKGISLLVNPVMVKEFRTRRFGRSHWMLRLVAISAILSVGLSCAAALGALGWGVEVIGGALVLLQAALLILFAPSLSAGLISSEREGGGWQLLRMTPLSPGAIVRGKLMSAAWPVLLLLAATFPGYVVMTTIKPETAPQVERVLLSLGLTAAFAVLVGAAASSLFRSTAAATAAAYLALVAVCVAPLLVWLGREAPFGHATVQAALTINPVAAALHAADTPGFTTYDLLPANWWVVTTACVGLVVLLAVRTRQLYRPE